MLPLPAWAAARTPSVCSTPYIEEENVRLVGVEAGGLGVDTPDHAAPITSKAPIGVLHGFRQLFDCMKRIKSWVNCTLFPQAWITQASARNTAI